MELIFPDVLYGSPEWEEGKYSKELTSQLVYFDSGVSVTDTDIGHGADWPVVLVEIFKNIDWSSFLSVSGIGGLFLMGEKINRNLDAWTEVGKKLTQLIKKIKPARVDEYGAAVLIINDFLKTNRQAKELNISIQIIEFTPVSWGKGILGKRPDALYIITVKTDNKSIIYGMKSNMKIEFMHELSNEWIEF